MMLFFSLKNRLEGGVKKNGADKILIRAFHLHHGKL